MAAEILSGEEERVFRRLAVFEGGCTLEAAQHVCEESEPDLAARLRRLAARALVAVEDGGPRYRLPEPGRAEARRMLAGAGEDQAAGDRHLAYFVQLATAARPQLAGPQQGAWLARLDLERRNLLAAHAWAGRDERHAAQGLRLANSLKLYWMNRGLLPLGLSVTLEALHRPGAQQPTPDRAQALFNAGQIRYFMGRYREARRLLEASLELARGLGEPYAAAVLQPLGMAAIGEGDFVLARRCLDESLQLAQGRGDRRSLAGAANALGMLYRVQGQRERARPYYEQVVRLTQAEGNDEGRGVGLLNLAMVRIDQGFPEEGRRLLGEAMEIVSGLRSVPGAQSALDVCAALACLEGDWACAVRLASAADSQASLSGVRRDPADAMFLDPKVARARNMLSNAERDAAQREGAQLPLLAALAEARHWLDRKGGEGGARAGRPSPPDRPGISGRPAR